MSGLAKLVQIKDLREVWKHEARDFSKWLSDEENLNELSEAVGLSIILDETESAVGSFSVDLYATEEGSGKKIIIENQLEDTDHDHLGKIITYAAGKDADIIIWIVKRARDEHRQAVEWLNRRTDDEVSFFLVEIELWKIGDSKPAPKFNVVEKPNEWAMAMRTSEQLSDTRKLQYDFWRAFIEYAYDKPEFSSAFGRRKASPQHWYNLSIGSSEYEISLTVNTQKKRLGVELYIYDNKELFTKLTTHKAEIESFLGMQAEWREAKKACRIITLKDGDIKQNVDSWQDTFAWLANTAISYKNMIAKFDV